MKVEEPVIRMIQIKLNTLMFDVKHLARSDETAFDWLMSIMLTARALAKVAEAELVNHPK